MTATSTAGRAAGPPSPARCLLAAGAERALDPLRRFARDTRAAAGLVAALLTIGTLAGGALIVDHVWLYDQRDVLKTAADAGAVAATREFNRQLATNATISDADLKKKLEAVAKSYVLINLEHLPQEQRERLRQNGELTITFPVLDRAQRTIQVNAEANLGGTLFSRYLPLLGHYAGPGSMQVKAGVDSDSKPVEVVLAIDTSTSMKANLEDVYTDPHVTLPADQCTASSLARACSRMAIVQRAASHLVDILQPDETNRVAVGLVPWHIHVRLDQPTADRWTHNQWARYPKRRHYETPWLNCLRYQLGTCTYLPAGVEEALPGTPPRTWQRCLDEDRMDPGASSTLAALPDIDQSVGELLAPPSQKPFAQGYFPASFGVGYQCLDPRSSSFPSELQFQRCYEPPPGLALTSEELSQHKVYTFPSSQAQCNHGTLEILPLSTDPDAIKQEIRTLSPVGALTYSALGVLWGQRLLEHSWKNAWGGTGAHPVGPTDPDADKVRKAIVLLTDGEDSSCGIGNHGCDEVGGRRVGVPRATACTEAKKKGTEIFVIAAVKLGSNSALGQGLADCSSENDQLYPAGTKRPGTRYVFINNSDPAHLTAAFAEIANHLRTLRRIL